MPIFEFSCASAKCRDGGVTHESYLTHWTKPNPGCPECSSELRRLPALTNAIWTKPYGQYGKKNLEYYSEGGVTAYRTKSSRLADGSPERVRLDTVQQVREYCKAEGLRDPSDVNSNAEIGADGRSLQTRGVSGQWL